MTQWLFRRIWAVNLALQQPLLETDFVRAGRVDFTGLRPNDTIQPTGHALPEEFHQKTFYYDFSNDSETRPVMKRVPSLKKDQEYPIETPKVDVVIMNPPFTSQNNLSEDYGDC